MKNPVLVVMAAGIGSRFGGGIKQLASCGPNGEIILDLSIKSAINAGFDKIVFIIRHDIEKDFKKLISNKYEDEVEIEYIYQDDPCYINGKKEILPKREKPYGTGHAILMCKNIINSPFLVINADDYYGIEIYKKMFDFLKENEPIVNGKSRYILAGFMLGNTLSKNGTVTRGVCKVDDRNYLKSINESYELKKDGDLVKGYIQKDSEKVYISYNIDTPTSMNMWGIYPDIFDYLEKGFDIFYNKEAVDNEKAEYLLPKVIDDMIKDNVLDVYVIKTTDEWFGVTYKEDVEIVRDKIKTLYDKGLYK